MLEVSSQHIVLPKSRLPLLFEDPCSSSTGKLESTTRFHDGTTPLYSFLVRVAIISFKEAAKSWFCETGIRGMKI